MRRTFYKLSLLGIAAILISELTACQPYIALKEEIAKGPYGANWGNTSKYDRAIKKNPNDAAAFYNRGTLRYSSGRTEKAIADFTQVIRINPTDPNAFPSTVGAYSQRGRLYHRLGDKQKALADYHKVAEICKQQKDNFCYERALDDIKWVQQSSPSTP